MEYTVPENFRWVAFDIEPGGNEFISRYLGAQRNAEAESTTQLGFVFNWFEEVRNRLETRGR
jgi:hypothetical protein